MARSFSLSAYFHEPMARWGRMFLLSAVVGIFSGLAAVALHFALEEGVKYGIGRFTDFSTFHVMDFNWGILLLPVLGGLVGALLVIVLTPTDHEHGTNQFIAAFHRHLGQLGLKGPTVKATGAVGVISCGGSAGPEGPIAALGAAIGSTFGRVLSLTAKERRILLVAGCAGGVGAIFQCPLGGALFATGILYREPEFEADGMVSAFVSSVISYSTFMLFFGFGGHLLTGADQLVFSHPLELIPYAILGPICAGLSIFFFYCLRTVESRPLKRLNLPRWVAPALGGLGVGILACALPQVMDGQYASIRKAMALLAEPLEPGRTWWTWAALFGMIAVFKCVATALTVGTGAPGGVLGPSVYIGGAAGACLSAVLQATCPGVFPPDLAPALVPVGMAGVLAAAMRTPIAAVVMVTEMTGSYGLIVPLMLVCVTSYVMGRRWGLNTAQVRSSVESPVHAGDALIHMLESWQVRDLMDREWPYKVHPATSLGEMAGRMRAGTRPVFAVVDNDRLVGIVSVADISRILDEPGISHLVIASDIMTTRLRVIEPDQSLYEVLETFRATNYEVLPVVSDDGRQRFEGMLRRSAIHEAVRSRSDEIRGYMHQEHAGIAAFEQDEQFYQLAMGVSAPRPDTVQRMPVPHDAVGKSLRDTDFRRRYGAQVIGVQSAEGMLQCPPDIDAPLRPDQLLLVILSAPSDENSAATAE